MNQQSSSNTTVIYPSPIIVAAPVILAVSLVAGGVVRETLQPEHSNPALLLLILSYLFSRWFRRAAVVITDESITIGDTVIRLEDIARIAVEPTVSRWRGGASLNVFDNNGVSRLTLRLSAYGTGIARLRDALRPHLPEKVRDDLRAFPSGKQIYWLWSLVGMLCILALLEGFTM